jgi:hypothetical protein
LDRCRWKSKDHLLVTIGLRAKLKSSFCIQERNMRGVGPLIRIPHDQIDATPTPSRTAVILHVVAVHGFEVV